MVCESVNERGNCRNPTEVLEVGREYRLVATGYGMPHGFVRLRVHRELPGRVEQEAEATVQVAADARSLSNPLRLAHRGTYVLEVVDSEGSLFASTRVRAPNSMFTAPRSTPPGAVPGAVPDSAAAPAR